MGNKASPDFVYACEITLAQTYALRNPALALDCAWHAYSAAVEMHRPDLAYAANDLMAAIVMGGVVLHVIEVCHG